MTTAEAHAWSRIAHQLAGSIVLEGGELEDDVALLVEAAGVATGLVGTLDVDAILETLGHLAQWHADAGRP